MATVRLEVVTPEQRIYSDDVDMVVIPAAEGEMGILAGHVPTVAGLLPGALRITKAGRTSELLVGNGFVEVTHTTVSVLTDMALEEVAIDERAAEEAVQRAEAALRERSTDIDAREDEEALLRRSLAQLQFKRRRRGQPPAASTALGGGEHIGGGGV
jgi:F-type H+-transporting ATPase subunit epsilon